MPLKTGQLVEHRDAKYRAIVTDIAPDEIEIFIFYNPPPDRSDPMYYPIGLKTIKCRMRHLPQPSNYWLHFFRTIQ